MLIPEIWIIPHKFAAKTLFGGGPNGQCGSDWHEILSANTRRCHFGLFTQKCLQNIQL